MPMKDLKKCNDKQTTLPTGDTGDKSNGSFKIDLPNKSKYGK